ncbi:hypothetical protein EMIT0P176_10432 [Pseudomonas sp. IT-P176]
MGCPLGLSVGGRGGARILIRFTGGHAYEAIDRSVGCIGLRKKLWVYQLNSAFSPKIPF